MCLQKSLSQFIGKLYLDFFKKRVVSDYFFGLLKAGFFFLPLGTFPSNFFLTSAIPIGFLMCYKDSSHWKKSSSKIAILSIPGLIVILATSLLYSFDVNYGIKLLLRSSPLFFFPIIFLFVSVRDEKLKEIIKFLSYGLIASFLLNISLAIYESLSIIDSALIFNSSLSGEHSFFESFNHGGNNFFGGELSKNVHPSYLSVYILIALTFRWFKKGFDFKKEVPLILLLYLFLLASRSAIFCLSIIFLLSLFNKGGRSLFIKKALLFLCFSVLFLVLNPRVYSLYQRGVDFFSKENYTYTTSEQSRFLVYKTSIDLIAQSPLFGYGVGDANEELYIKYIDRNYKILASNRYNAHSQYFQVALQVGLLGLIMLLYPFLYGIFKSRQYYLKFSFFILAFGLAFESMLIRYHGILFFSIVLPVLIKSIDEKISLQI